MVVEQNYGEMNARYQEVMAAKQRMESEVMALQASLDAERNARSQEAQHAMELNGEAVELGVGGDRKGQGEWGKRDGGKWEDLSEDPARIRGGIKKPTGWEIYFLFLFWENFARLAHSKNLGGGEGGVAGMMV